MKLKLDRIELRISKKLFGKTNVEFEGKTIFVNDTEIRTIEVIKENYEKIKNYYIENLSQNEIFDFKSVDLSEISLKILLHYLDQYSKWKEQYKKSNYDIKFYEKDFSHPTTYDIIILFLKEKYTENWKSISEKYLNMTSKEFDFYWTNRLNYYNL